MATDIQKTETAPKKSLMDLIKERQEYANRDNKVVAIDFKEKLVITEAVKFVLTEKIALSILANVTKEFGFDTEGEVSHLAEDGKKPETYGLRLPGVNAFLNVSGKSINVRMRGETRSVGKIVDEKNYTIFEDQREALVAIASYQKTLAVK